MDPFNVAKKQEPKPLLLHLHLVVVLVAAMKSPSTLAKRNVLTADIWLKNAKDAGALAIDLNTSILDHTVVRLDTRERLGTRIV